MEKLKLNKGQARIVIQSPSRVIHSNPIKVDKIQNHSWREHRKKVKARESQTPRQNIWNAKNQKIHKDRLTDTGTQNNQVNNKTNIAQTLGYT